MHSVWYDLNFVKGSFKFLFFEDRKIFCDLNFLSLPFYFGNIKKFIKYYRFESSIINYTKLKNSSSVYLIFGLHSKSSLKVRSDNLFDLLSSSFSTIFKSKKYYGYLLANSFGDRFFLQNLKSDYNFYDKNLSVILSNDYFSVDSLELSFLNVNKIPLFFSNTAHYFSLFYNRFHRRYQNSFFDIDLFISSYITDLRRDFSNTFWDICPKFFVIDNKMNLRSFFLSSNMNGSDKYFSYFFLGHFVKKISLKLRITSICSLFRKSPFINYFHFILNSILNKLDSFFFLFFDKCFFFNFIYKFLNSFSFSNHFFVFWGDKALLLLNKIFVFWSINYFLHKIWPSLDSSVFFFRYIFIVLINLFFNFVYNIYFSSTFTWAPSSAIYSKLIGRSASRLARKIYISKSLLKMGFKKHVVLLFNYGNFQDNSKISKLYFSSKKIAPKLHYSHPIHLKVKNFLFKFKNIFLCFFKRNFFLDDVVDSSLLNFRFIIGNFFFRTSIFRFKERFWKNFLILNRKFLYRLFFFLKKKLIDSKSFYIKRYLRLFGFYRSNYIYTSLNWNLQKKFNFYLNINKRKLFGANLFHLKSELKSKLSFVKNELIYSSSFFVGGFSFILLYIILHLSKCNIILYDYSFFKLHKQVKLAPKFSYLIKYVRFYCKTTIDLNYLISNLDLFCSTFSQDVFRESFKSGYMSFFYSNHRPKLSCCYMFYFFSYLFSFKLFKLKFLQNISNYFLRSSYVTDMRFFICITLFMNKFFIRDFKSFFNYNRRFLYRFSDFNLKIDFFLAMFFGDYIEYFRIFKYNEYISSNLYLESYMIKTSFLLKEYPKLHLIKHFVNLKKHYFFSSYNIYKIYFTLDVDLSYGYYDSNFILQTFPQFSFWKFFFIYFRLKNALWLFSNLFYGYFLSYLLHFLHKSLIVLPSLFEVQVLSAENFFEIADNIKFLSIFFGFSLEGSLVSVIFLKASSFLFADRFLLNNFFTTHLQMIDNPSFRYKRKDSEALDTYTKNHFEGFFFYNLNRLLVLDYMDSVFFDSMLDFADYTLLKLVDLIIFWLKWGYLSFVQLDSTYDTWDFLDSFKYSLDFLLWDIYNFSCANDLYSLTVDMRLYLRVRHSLISKAYFLKTLDMYLILFFSVLYNYSNVYLHDDQNFAVDLKTKDSLPDVDFNLIAITLGFLLYFFLRDFFLNCISFFFNSIGIFNHHFVNLFSYLSYFSHFDHISFAFRHFHYLFNFQKFTFFLKNKCYLPEKVYDK